MLTSNENSTFYAKTRCDYPHCKPEPETAWAQKHSDFDQAQHDALLAKLRVFLASLGVILAPPLPHAPTQNNIQTLHNTAAQAGLEAHPLLANFFNGADPKVNPAPQENPDAIEDRLEAKLQLQNALRYQHSIRPHAPF